MVSKKDTKLDKDRRPKTKGANNKDRKKINAIVDVYGFDRDKLSEYLHDIKETSGMGASQNHEWSDLVDLV